eukprot:6334351-Amphidinium_carterae.1
MALATPRRTLLHSSTKGARFSWTEARDSVLLDKVHGWVPCCARRSTLQCSPCVRLGCVHTCQDDCSIALVATSHACHTLASKAHVGAQILNALEAAVCNLGMTHNLRDG